MLICPGCGGEWSVVGKDYIYDTGDRYKCQECDCKKKPIELSEEEGSLEYTNKHELTDNGYKVYYGDTYIVATHEDIRKALMMYCVGNLTMNQVSMKMLWTRQEFNAIKTAFHITKDSIPFTPYEIDDLTTDQMAEITRVEKKRYAISKLEYSAHKDIKKEIDRHHKADYFMEQICERVNKIDVSSFFVKKQDKSNTPKTHLIKITDEHSGLTVDSLYNTYNLDVMKERFETTTKFIINNVPVGPVIIESGGDVVHGLIHGSTEKASTYVMDSLEEVIGCYIRLFKTLRELGYSITFAKANGSHSSLESNKMNRTEEENLGRMLTYTLKRVFEDDFSTEILPTIQGTNHTLIELGGNKAAILGHGDEMKNAKAYAAYARLVGEKKGVVVKEFHLGHYHHEKAEYIDGVFVEHSLSFCGTDQYASKLGLISPCGITYIIYENGNRLTKQIVEF